VVAALVAGAQLGAGSPALADPPTVQVISLDSASLDPGDRTTLRFSVRNNNNGNPPGGGVDNTARVTVRTDFGELRCDGRCEFDEQINGPQPRQFEVSLVAGDVPAGETKSGKVRIEVTINNETGSAERGVTVRGPQEAPSAKKVSGQVVDVATGDAIPAAAVAMQDSQNHTFNAETDDRGRFSFTSSGRNPISPGRIDIAVGLTGYANVEKQFEVKRGQSLTGIKISLTSTASPSPTAEPSAPVTTAPPSTAALNPTSAEEGGGTLSWVLILLGGLLVALGVGAIVLLIVRRRQEAREEDVNGEGPGGGPPIVPAPGRYRGDDATRIVGGAGMGGDPTMVGRPGLADAPTMLQAPVRDEYPDPYGLPPQQPGAPTQAYGAAAQPGWGGGGYSDATQAGGYPGAPGAAPAGPPGTFGPGGVPAPYGSPAMPGGYGQPGGYDGGRGTAGGPGGRGEFADRYDDPTGRFNAPGAESGPAAGRYGDPTPGYAPTSGGPPPGYAPTSGGPPPGYAGPTSGVPNAGYGQPAAPGGYDQRGYDQRGYGADPYDSGQAGRAGGGYPGPTSSAGGYATPGGPGAPGGPPGGGYDQRRGYEPQDTGGYGGPSGYDQRGGGYAGPGGAAAPAGGGYDPRGGYPSANPPSGYPPPSGGYEQAPGGYDDAGQRGGYDPRSYEQGGYYPEQQQGGQPPRQPGPPPQAPPPPPRSERRSLDWLDD
jgi:hypothetical protein